MEEFVFGPNNGEVIQFLHANAYTPKCYRKMMASLVDYKIVSPSQRPLWKDSDPSALRSWSILADDLIAHMDAIERRGVIGMGHSLGGVVTWLAAIKRPDLFKKLVLIDPVILPLSFTIGIKYIPIMLKKKYVPIVKIASKRRDRWENREAAREYFLSKKVFQRFDDEVLEDFISFGLDSTEDGVVLAYPRSWEAKVYATAPYLWNKMKKSPCPITILRAQYSDVINDHNWSRIQSKLDKGHFIEIQNTGHLMPFEQPQICADYINESLRSWGEG